MLHSFTILLFVAALTVGSYASGPVPSQTPPCFTCPPKDLEQFPLGDKNEESDPIFCSYPAVQGEDPADFFCTYSKTNGKLVQDNDAGFCPPNAVNSCASGRKKRDAFPRSPRVPLPQDGSPKPEIMQTRNKLGMVKRQAHA